MTDHTLVHSSHRRPHRRASILIMVIAVLVMLALMGTAFISTARVDRAASVQNAQTPRDIVKLMTGQAEQTAREAIEVETFADASMGWQSLKDFSAMSRLPTLLGAPQTVAWRWISAPIKKPNGNPTYFESPYYNANRFPASVPVPQAPYLWIHDPETQAMHAGSIAITYPDDYSEPSLRGRTRVFPALAKANLNGTPAEVALASPVFYLAGDADGDGIADCGLWRLEGAPSDRIAYYVGYRVIDENSAINVNTALSRDADFDFTGTAIPNSAHWAIYPSSVGLFHLLNGPSANAEMTALNARRFNQPGSGFPLPVPNPTPINDPLDLSMMPRITDSPGGGGGGPVTPTAAQPAAIFFGTDADLDRPQGYGTGKWKSEDSRFDVAQTRLEDIYEFFNEGVKKLETDDDGQKPHRSTANASARSDFAFLSIGDAMYHMLSRRLSFPGVIKLNQSPGVDIRYNPFSVGDALDLRYQFSFVNPERATVNDMGEFEKTLLGSTVSGTPNYDGNKPEQSFNFFTATDVAYWFASTFHTNPSQSYGSFGPGNWRTLRPILTTRNPVSALWTAFIDPQTGDVPHVAMLPYASTGRWDQFNDYKRTQIVTYSNETAPRITASYIALQDHTARLDDPNSSSKKPDPNTNTPQFWARLNPRTIWEVGVTYRAGDVVYRDVELDNPKQNPQVEKIRLFVCMNTGGTTAKPTEGVNDNDWWMASAANTRLPRLAVNTAPFEELFRGFWNLLLRNANDATNGTFFEDYEAAVTLEDGGAAPENAYFPMSDRYYNPYVGNRFQPEAMNFAPGYNPGMTTYEKHPLRMFRSSLRAPAPAMGPGFFPAGGPDYVYRFDAKNMAQLRAAIAAVNAIDLRDRDGADFLDEMDDTITVRKIQLEAIKDPPAAGDLPTKEPVEVTVYGTEKQPFITEVLANNVITPDRPYGYIAIELHNPYSEPMDLTGYRLAAIDRRHPASPTSGGFGAYPDMPILEVDGSDAAMTGVIIPPGGYVIIESSGTGNLANTSERPTSAQPDPNLPTPPQVIPLLTLVSGGIALPSGVYEHELVVMRAPDLAAPPADLVDWVPVDSFDLTGMPPPPPVGSGLPNQAWHYVRASDPTNGMAWRMVYPGRYDATQTNDPVNGILPRQQGTEAISWNGGPFDDDGWAANEAEPGPGFSFGSGDSSFGLPHQYKHEDLNGNGILEPGEDTNGNGQLDIVYSYSASYPTTFAIQLNNVGWPGRPAAWVDASIQTNATLNAANQARFSGFQRAGDVLQVPFIGAYRVQLVDQIDTANVLEMNSVTMDAAMAEDADPENDAFEYVGRFAPESTNYEFANRFFEVVTAIQNGGDDMLPNTEAADWMTLGASLRPPDGTSNSGAPRNSTADGRRAGIEGLININTAPARVLAALPLVMNDDGTVNAAESNDLAEAIVAYRDANGPFTSLWQLNLIPTFKDPVGTPLDSMAVPETQGDFSPVDPAVTQPPFGDFERQYLQLTRLSNLLTTRSDFFTVYLVVQGWKNVGSPYPQLVAEERRAFTIDRSGSVQPETQVIPVRRE